MNFAEKLMLAACVLLTCGGIAAHWGRNMLTRHFPWLSAAAEGTDRKSSWSASRRESLGRMRLGVFLTFIGIPILLGGVIFGALHLSAVAARPAGTSLLPTGIGAAFVAANAVLYLMGTAASIKQHPWKWLLLGLMVLVPLGIGVVATGSLLERLRSVTLYLGLAWLISGGATLSSYLRHTQPPAPEAP